jgi:hypothetical protein
VARELESLKRGAMSLPEEARRVIEAAIAEVCSVRGWTLGSVYVGSNHVHAVVGGPATPERMMNDFKAYATRTLRYGGYAEVDRKVWSRHGSTVYLWSDEEVARATYYVSDLQSIDR